jgi:ATP synthase protein I
MSPSKQNLVADDVPAEVGEVDFKPLTASEASALRKTFKHVSIWRVVLLQAVVAVVIGFCAAGLVGSEAAGWSAAYGGFSIVLPSMVMAHGVTSSRLARLLSVFPAGSLGGVVFWEGVKVLLVVVMLVLAPVVVSALNWLALLAGLVIVLKVYWFAFLMLSRVKK